MGSRLRAYALLIALAVSVVLPMAGSAGAAPRSVTVAVRDMEPFVITGGTGKSGFTIDLWEEIAHRRGWSTEYVDAPNVGAQLKDVAERKAEVGAGAISITAERRRSFDFSQPIFNGGLQILVPHHSAAPAEPRLVNFLPLLFSKAMFVWLVAGLILSVIPAHIFWIVERRRNDVTQKGAAQNDVAENDAESSVSRAYFPGIFQSFAWSLGFLGFMPDTFPHRIAGRLLGILWGFVALIYVAYFTATLTTNLTVSTYAGQISGPSDLPGKKVATVAGTTSSQHLADMGIPAADLPSIDECYRGLRAGRYDAVVFDAPVLQYYASGTGAGAVQIAGPIFHSEDYGFAFAPSSELRPQVDQSLLEIRRDGTYDLIRRKWFGVEESHSDGAPG